MRRLQKMIENALIGPREQYIETRITQLKMIWKKHNMPSMIRIGTTD